jgi:hypothetical protein
MSCSVPWLAVVRKAPEVEDGELAQVAGDLHDVIPPAGNFVENDEQTHDGPGNIEEHLHHVGPDDCGHPAFEGVEEGEAND